ncbi:3(or 17)beta-hydroxysteroid dehydrogenase [Pseudomonas laurylsulfatiphila]|jgi:NAD(P)-dependent dehydrogenase (short-subunit alcohol dehydrogenase family)|uniref:SDR family NAD(P)-dependent oxidoreductase n=1 Tax=Pseudomonas laurylsulfatiphila TaxID=2011015 RepID=UPI003D1A1610
MTDRLKGKVALVTGGAGAFGQAIAKVFVEEGAQVVISDVSPSVHEVAQSIGCLAVKQDVTNEAEWQKTLSDIEARFGKIDVLVNNAGILGDISKGNPEETELDDFNKVIAVNLTSAFLGCKTVIPFMRRAGKGSIVNVSSIAALMGTWFETAYGVSKAGMMQLSMSVASYGAKESIRCNTVHPGQMDNVMTSTAYETLAPKFGFPNAEAAKEKLLSLTPMGRLGLPIDVAYAVAYLASDESQYVTGTSLVVDGGMNAT